MILALIDSVSVVEMLGREDLEVAFVDKDDGQVDCHSVLRAVLRLVVTDVPRVRVGDVSDNDRTRVDGLLFGRRTGGKHKSQQRKNDK